VFEVQPEQVDFIVADLSEFTRGEVVALALNVDANLRSSPPLGTPVDTGWARANWIPSINEPALMDARVKDPTPEQVAARQAIAEGGLNDLLAWRLESGPIFDSNNVEYIGVLNAGHSPQSPPGFVQNALEKAVRETESSAGNRRQRNARAATYRANKPRPKR
jgi:hypothetical protein